MMLSVDPGIHTGYALWYKQKLEKVGTLNFKGILWEDKAYSVLKQFDFLLRTTATDVTEVVIEFPGYMHGTGGHMVATSGDLVKLAVMTGMLMSCAKLYGARVVAVPVNQWKGQLPKDVCKARVLRKMPGMGMEKLSDHAWDAIGIGLWKLGRF